MVSLGTFYALLESDLQVKRRQELQPKPPKSFQSVLFCSFFPERRVFTDCSSHSWYLSKSTFSAKSMLLPRLAVL